MTAASPTIGKSSGASRAEWLRGATPALLFGLRLWASVCLSFYVAFALELSEPSWAATTAALVCQPVLGASLRKSMFRMIGTVIGAVAIVVLAAFFRQDRAAFLVGLRSGARPPPSSRRSCAISPPMPRRSPVIRRRSLQSTFLVRSAARKALSLFSPSTVRSRSASALSPRGFVLALTDLGHSRRKLAAECAALSSAIMDGFGNAFGAASVNLDQFRALRRELLRRVIALDPMIDAAIGEASDLRYRSAVLQRAVSGLMETLSAWRKVTFAIALRDSTTPREANAVRDLLPRARLSPEATSSTDEPAALRDACCSAVRPLTRLEAETPMQRLLADNAAVGMLGMARALNGLTGVIDPRDTMRVKGRAHLHVADWLPAFVNAVRVLFAVGAVSLFWIMSAWPNGVAAITFCAVIVILLPLQGDLAYSASMTFLREPRSALPWQLRLPSEILPQATTFPSLCLALGLALVPFGFLIALPWRHSFLFTAATFNFVPMLNVTNGMNVDGSQFWNGAISILAGIAAGAVAMLIIPPVSPAIRTQRLLSLTLMDFRRLVRRASPGRAGDWEQKGFARLLAMPDKAGAQERAELAAMVAVGKEIVRLRHIAPRFVSTGMVDAALAALAEGRSSEAIARLGDIDRQVAALPRASSRILLSLRAGILAISGQLSEFESYFDRQLQ